MKIAVGQMSQWVCPTRHRHHLFESNLSQQADVRQQPIHEAVEGASHGFSSRIKKREQRGAGLSWRDEKNDPEDRLSGFHGCIQGLTVVYGRWYGCNVTSGFPLSHSWAFSQLAPQCYVTARFEISPRGPAGRVVSHSSLIIVFVKRGLVGVVYIGLNTLTVSPRSLVRRV